MAGPGARNRRLRYIPLAIGAVSLGVGFWTGLTRIGIALPGEGSLDDLHGALMICGFFGTLISLERAVALNRAFAYAAPALSALGAVALLFHAPLIAGALFVLASVMLTVATGTILVRIPTLFTAVLTLAAICWGLGTLVWLTGQPMADAAGWWLAFLVLTIAGERLELSRLLAPSRPAQALFVIAIVLIVLGAARGEFDRDWAPLTALGYLACTAWLLVHDIARRTVRQSGQTRFSATCMLAGYFWLGITGLYLLVSPPGSATFAYDAAVHGIAIGFVLSMVFGHALIILPAVTGISVHYHPAVYGALVLLHASVALRVVSDYFELIGPRAFSGPLTILALVGFAGTIAFASRPPRGARRTQDTSVEPSKRL
ncbi:MAG: hypothetical protein R3D62_08290 [Xanthobacteraceae bacterium]